MYHCMMCILPSLSCVSHPVTDDYMGFSLFSWSHHRKLESWTSWCQFCQFSLISLSWLQNFHPYFSGVCHWHLSQSQYYSNGPVTQIPQCKSPISHNAPFVTEMCTCVHISVTKWCIVGYMPDALWDLWDGSIPMEHSWRICVKSGYQTTTKHK